MLVLSRRAGESLAIGDTIKVRILEVKGELVKVGIDAPREITVHRQEVYDAIEKENQAAARVKKDVLFILKDKIPLTRNDDDSSAVPT